MKKLIYILIFTFTLLFYNNSFAFISKENQEIYKQQSLKSYKKFETEIDKYSIEDQKIILDRMTKKINLLLDKKLSEKNKFIIKFLKENIDKKASSLNNKYENEYNINYNNMNSSSNSNKIINIKNLKVNSTLSFS
jgi:hypothetical protein